MPEEYLKPCEHCGSPAFIQSNRDWHRLIVAHDPACFRHTGDEERIVPATPDDRAWMVAAWNRRDAAPSATPAPAPVTVSDEMVERISDVHRLTTGENIGPLGKMRAALEAYESARGAAPVTVSIDAGLVEGACVHYDIAYRRQTDADEYTKSHGPVARACAMRAALEAYESARSAGDGWTITKNKSPVECTDVDAIWWGGDRKMAYLRDGVWWYYGQMGVKAARVAPEYWRPLPPPPSDKAREE